jgi:hypothetical protein
MPNSSSTKLSKYLANIWPEVEPYHLILATQQFIVWLDEELDIEWKTKPTWDKKFPKDEKRHRSLIVQVAELEAADWDYSDPKRTRNYKRQLAEVLACSFEHDYKNAESMLHRVKEYRAGILKTREGAIQDQVAAKINWKKHSVNWMAIHYFVGVVALLLSTFLAARPTSLQFDEKWYQTFAWAGAFFTGLLTFLNPEKKASRYRRAWVLLNNQITRYQSDKSYQLEPVLNAHVEGQNLIAETTDQSGKQNPIIEERRKARA